MKKLKQNEGLENRHKLNESNDFDVNVKGLNIQNDESNPFNKWALDTVYALYMEAGREDEFWDVITNNAEIMQMPSNRRFRRSIIVGEKVACRLLDLSDERNENDEDYYQLYDLRMRGKIYKFSKSGLDSLIEKYPVIVEGCKNDPLLLGHFLDYHMSDAILNNLPYTANPARDNIGSN